MGPNHTVSTALSQREIKNLAERNVALQRTLCTKTFVKRQITEIVQQCQLAVHDHLG